MSLEQDGYFIQKKALAPFECDSIIESLASVPHQANRGGIRNLIENEAISCLVRHPSIVDSVQRVLGRDAFAYKATLFEKSPIANWLVTWHQDTFVPLASREETAGWTGWCVKGGIIHAKPPHDVLENVLAVRVHLDASTESNGPLRVVPGSHTRGCLSEIEIACLNPESKSIACLVPRGGLLLMRPLLLHASSKSVSTAPRRVIHFEFANVTLPGKLNWACRVPLYREMQTSHSQ